MNATLRESVIQTCVKCELKFHHWPDYSAHTLAANCFKVIKPVKLTTRTKAQIVTEWEYLNHKHLVY